MAKEAFEAGSYTVSYGVHIPTVAEYISLRVNGMTSDMLSSPREKLQEAFRQAGVEPRFMGTDMMGVVNCDLTSEGQLKKLEAAGYHPERGHCGCYCS